MPSPTRAASATPASGSDRSAALTEPTMGPCVDRHTASGSAGSSVLDGPRAASVRTSTLASGPTARCCARDMASKGTAAIATAPSMRGMLMMKSVISKSDRGNGAPFLLLSTPSLGSRPQTSVSVACGVPVNELTAGGPARARASAKPRHGGSARVRDRADSFASADRDRAAGEGEADRVVARCRTRSAEVPTVTWRATGRLRLRPPRA